MEDMLRKYEIDIIISAVGGDSILDQLSLVQAMKSVGTIKVNLYNIFIFLSKEKREKGV